MQDKGVVYCVAVSLSKNDGATVTHTMTQSWSAGDESSAIVSALEFAKNSKPGFSVDDWLVAEIPIPAQPQSGQTNE